MMSGSNNEIPDTGAAASSAEPSMEEILASIRRILKDDQSATAETEEEEEDILVLDSSMVVKPGAEGSPAPEPAAPLSPTPEALAAHANFEAPPAAQAPLPEPIEAPSTLEPGLVAPSYEDEQQWQPSTNADQSGVAAEPQHSSSNDLEAGYYSQAEAPATHEAMEEKNMSDATEENVQPPDGLVSDAASDAAAGSIGALIRTISSDRQIAVGRAGLTLEDLVREELRPLLKAWLDTNLPALVERIVRGEIQRVIERSGI